MEKQLDDPSAHDICLRCAGLSTGPHVDARCCIDHARPVQNRRRPFVTYAILALGLLLLALGGFGCRAMSKSQAAAVSPSPPTANALDNISVAPAWTITGYLPFNCNGLIEINQSGDAPSDCFGSTVSLGSVSFGTPDSKGPFQYCTYTDPKCTTKPVMVSSKGCSNYVVGTEIHGLRVVGADAKSCP